MKKVLALILAVISVVSFSVVMVQATNADNGIMPCLNNTNSASVTIGIDSSGEATIAYNCIGISGVTTRIVAETKLERKWGLLWLDVDGAEWTDSTNGKYLSGSHTVNLEKTGTYRATAVYTVTGTGGSADNITCQAQDTY